MNKLVPFFLLLLLPGLCDAQYDLLLPCKVQVLGFENKLEARATIAVKPQVLVRSRQEYAYKVKPNFGYELAGAVINHLAILGGFYNVRWTNENVTVNEGYKIDIGLGYFKTFSKNRTIECTLIYSRGHMLHNLVDDPDRHKLADRYYKTDYNALAIQPALTGRKGWFAISGGFRLSYQRCANFQTDQAYLDDYAPNEVTGFVQPFLDIEMGRLVNFNFQTGLSHQIYGHELNDNSQLYGYATLGLAVHFVPSHWEKKEKKDTVQ